MKKICKEGIRAMKVLVTGSRGFIGKNLTCALRQQGFEVEEYYRGKSFSELEQSCMECDFVFHLAGINRPEAQNEPFSANGGFTAVLLNCLSKRETACPVVFASSIQARQENAYGKSKKECEQLLLTYGQETNAPVFLVRLPNVFGKWSRPEYNSAVATFCHHISRGMPIQLHDPDAEVALVYIDDVVGKLISLLKQPSVFPAYPEVAPVTRITVGELAAKLRRFQQERTRLAVPAISDPFEKKLYSTYISFLPEDGFSYPLVKHANEESSFVEFLKLPERGQVSVNTIRPGIVKGNHWHHTKLEKFLAVSGEGMIRFRRLGETEILEYPVSGKRPVVVEAPPGYTHQIENTGESDLVLVLWANEIFDPEHQDTYFLEV